MSFRSIGGNEWRDLGTTGQGWSGPAETRGFPTTHSGSMYGKVEHESGVGRRSGFQVPPFMLVIVYFEFCGRAPPLCTVSVRARRLYAGRDLAWVTLVLAGSTDSHNKPLSVAR